MKNTTTKITLNEGARDALLCGAKKLCDTVKLTIGPKGRNAIIERKGSTPLITNDGVTIAREVSLADPVENLGAQVLRQASQKTCEKAGDGTTSAIVFAEKLLQNGHRKIALGESPILLRDGMNKAANFVAEYVRSIAKPCATFAQIQAVAANSCGNLEDGALIAKALERVGSDGVVTLEMGQTASTTLDFSDGMELDLELASPYFLQGSSKPEVAYSDAKLLLVAGQIKSINELLPTLEIALKDKQNLIIVANDFAPDVIAGLVVNKVRLGVQIMAYKTARLGANAHAILADVAALAGATVASAENDLTVANLEQKHLGCAQKVVCKIDGITIQNQGSEGLKSRVEMLKNQLESAKIEGVDEYNLGRLRERIARLGSGVAVISVGAATEVEARERYLRIEDGVAAARAAMGLGVVEGGGVAYIRAAKALEGYIQSTPEVLKPGAQVVQKSLDVILENICINAGVSSDIVLDRVKNNAERVGYNALSGEYCDMFEAKIIDPAVVVESVVVNAVSVVGTLLTTEAVLTEEVP